MLYTYSIIVVMLILWCSVSVCARSLEQGCNGWLRLFVVRVRVFLVEEGVFPQKTFVQAEGISEGTRPVTFSRRRLWRCLLQVWFGTRVRTLYSSINSSGGINIVFEGGYVHTCIFEICTCIIQLVYYWRTRYTGAYTGRGRGWHVYGSLQSMSLRSGVIPTNQ